jgi:hypothetical protein
VSGVIAASGDRRVSTRVSSHPSRPTSPFDGAARNCQTPRRVEVWLRIRPPASVKIFDSPISRNLAQSSWLAV